MNKTVALSALLSCLVLSGAAHAQVSQDLSKVQAGRYALDTSHANILFEVDHLGFSGYIGRFNKFDGFLTFDPKSKAMGAVDITIDAASIDTNHDELEGKLRGVDVFNVAKFPTIRFVGSRIDSVVGNKGKLHGDLTMMGVTKQVSMDVTFNGVGPNPYLKKDTLGFAASGLIKRSEWGLNSWLPFIGDDVILTVRAEFGKAD
jgi:polyisoprenoid-binding protein YceI